MKAAAGQKPMQGDSRLAGGRFFYVLFAFHNYYKFRFCLDLETVWRPEGTAVPEGGEGEAKQILCG